MCAVRRFSALVDGSNERSFPSSSPSIKRLLPHQSFTRRLISVKSMRLLVPALWLQTLTSLSGLHMYLLLYLFLSSSSSHSLPLCSPFQVFPGVSESLSSLLFLSSQDRWEQTAWQFSLFFLSSSLSSFPRGAALSVFPCHTASTFLQIELRESLDQPFEGAESALVYFYQQTRSLVDLDRCRYPPQTPRLRFTPFIVRHTHAYMRTDLKRHPTIQFSKVFEAI